MAAAHLRSQLERLPAAANVVAVDRVKSYKRICLDPDAPLIEVMIDWIHNLFETPASPDRLDPELRELLWETLRECESLYRVAARTCISYCPHQIGDDPHKFAGRMHDLHRGLAIKILIELGNCDRLWHASEREVAKLVLTHAWSVNVGDDGLEETLRAVARRSKALTWEALVEPFVEMSPLDAQIPVLTSLALRIAHLIAKADGEVQPSEAAALTKIERELEAALDSGRARKERAAPADRPADPTHNEAAQVMASAAEREESSQQEKVEVEPDKSLTPQERQDKYDEAMNELDELIGLDPIKQDVKQLVDFLKMQAHRQEHGLATAQVSLHTVFEGNPGTGKTTVARILGRIFCGLGILDKGHTFETDRSGLVAEFVGQTGPKTHRRIDDALHGVLFVDEAYSLKKEHGQDAFGEEALQAMLKRMEDDRDRLVVVLAGYPEPMHQLLRSNPGLSSRFQRTFSFPDYSAMELLQIFHHMCKQNDYRLTKETKEKLYVGFYKAVEEKDEHFGNARLARNVFELAIRRQASRLVNSAPLTPQLLTTLEPEDIEI